MEARSGFRWLIVGVASVMAFALSILLQELGAFAWTCWGESGTRACPREINLFLAFGTAVFGGLVVYLWLRRSRRSAGGRDARTPGSP